MTARRSQAKETPPDTSPSVRRSPRRGGTVPSFRRGAEPDPAEDLAPTHAAVSAASRSVRYRVLRGTDNAEHTVDTDSPADSIACAARILSAFIVRGRPTCLPRALAAAAAAAARSWIRSRSYSASTHERTQHDRPVVWTGLPTRES